MPDVARHSYLTVGLPWKSSVGGNLGFDEPLKAITIILLHSPPTILAVAPISCGHASVVFVST